MTIQFTAPAATTNTQQIVLTVDEFLTQARAAGVDEAQLALIAPRLPAMDRDRHTQRQRQTRRRDRR